MSSGSQLPSRLVSSSSESLSAAVAMKLKSGATGGHMLSVSLEYLYISCARQVVWILFSYCGFLVLLYLVGLRFNVTRQ